MKKILITSTDVMMYLFILKHVQFLAKNNYHIDVACSAADEYTNEGYDKIIQNALPNGSSYFHISSVRSPYSTRNIQAVRQIKTIIAKGKYDLIWTNEPVMGVITRIAARKFREFGTKVLYLSHGYHFFKGAPLKNWIYYPVEKLCSRITDVIVTINKTDYAFTKEKFSVSVKYINGIGFDANKYKNNLIDRESKRQELGVDKEDILILSAGELMPRKNHEVMIKALARNANKKLVYIICGIGGRLRFLQELANTLNVGEQVKFLGLRYDMAEILKAADIFAHPSRREGLGIAPLEAMATGLPIITSNAQGIKDYSIDGVTGYCLEPNDVDGFADAIRVLADDPDLRKNIGNHNTSSVDKWSIENSVHQVKQILDGLLMN